MDKKRILVTGVSRGIGRELVVALVKMGHQVHGISRNDAALDELKDQLAGEVGAFHPLQFDIGGLNLGALPDLLDIDELDVLINNAGSLINKPFENISRSELGEVYAINLQAPFFLIQKLLPLLKRSTSAHVINIGSMGGVNGTAKFSGLSAYSSSKGALSILTECLAEEYKDSGIHFNCLALGSANTEMLKEAFPEYEAPVSAETMAQYIAGFALEQGELYNGKTLPVSSTTP